MKKIIVLTAFLCMLLTSVCSAFKEPDPDRWIWCGSDNKLGYWFDIQTIKIGNGNDYGDAISCNKHRFVGVWILSYDVTVDESSISRWECDLDCDKYKITETTFYNNKGDVISSYNYKFANFQNAVPGSWGENILKNLDDWWDIFVLLKNENKI